MNSDMSLATETASYWCHRCARFVHLSPHHGIVCPHCQSGFVEEIHGQGQGQGHATPSPPISLFADALPNSRRQGFRRRRHHARTRSPFNPVIVLRGPPEAGEDDGGAGHGHGHDGNNNGFELYYDDGEGSGLQPLPPAMSEILLGSGFDRLLEQFSQIEINGFGFGRPENPPASKAAIESMPTIEINEAHVGKDAHCAVCTDAFELGSEAREMPCKHIYHSDCILPWLSTRNSCPLCRHELPPDQNPLPIGEETVGLTIWRLPGGGFAVGRFSGGHRAGEIHLPIVYTEMDGDNSSNGAPRRMSRAVRSTRVRESRGFGRIFRNFFSFFGRLGSRSTSSSSLSSSSSSSFSSSSDHGSMSRSHSQSISVFNRNSRRGIRTWAFED